MVQLAASARHTCEEWLLEYLIYFGQAPILCPRCMICPTLRATRAPWASRAGPPSSLGVELKADTSTFEYERHRACLSVETSNDEPSHVPLRARTLRGVALSSWWSSLLRGPHAFGPKIYILCPKYWWNSHTTVATSQWEGGQMELY